MTALGVEGIESLAPSRLTTKLKKAPDLADDDVELTDAEDETLTAVLEGLEGDGIKVVADPAAEEKPKAKKGKGKGKPAAKPEAVEEEEDPATEEAYEDEAEYEDADAEEKPATKPPAGRAKKKKDKEEKKQPKVPAAPTLPGVRLVRTRPYCAGVVLAAHGLAGGITEDMVREVDDLFNADRPAADQKSNMGESRFVIRNAFHAIRAYLGDDAGDVVAKETGKKK